MTATAVTPEPGIHRGIPFEDYAKWDAVNSSRLRRMAKSPKHYRCEPDMDNDTLRKGRAVHTAVFEPDRFPLEYAVYRGKTRRGKDWDAFSEVNSGKTILTEQQYDDALRMRDAVRGDQVAGPIVEADGEAELSVVWIDTPTDLLCRARIDCLRGGVLRDLKTTRDASPRRFANSFVDFGYDTQAAFYFDGLCTASGKYPCGFELICVENSPPWDVVVMPIPPDVLAAGRDKYRRMLDRVMICTDAG